MEIPELNFRFTNEVFNIIKKLEKNSTKLGEFCYITRGVNAYDKYRGQSEEIIKNRAYHSDHKVDNTYIPELIGRNVTQYSYSWGGKTWIKYGKWLAAPRDPKYFTGERIILRQIPSKRLLGTIIKEDFCIDQTIFIAKPKKAEPSLNYILGVIDSSLMAYYFKYRNEELDEVFPKVKLKQFESLPIKITNYQQPISELVDKILSLNKQKSQLLTPYFNLCENKKTEDWSLKKILDSSIIDATSSHNINSRFWDDDKYAKFDIQLDNEKRIEIIGLHKDKNQWEDIIKIAGINYNLTLHLYYCIRYILENKKVNNKTLEAFVKYIKIPVIKPNPHIEISDKIVNVFKEKFEDIDLPKIEMKIKETDNQIDEMVYELYGLTDEEIEVVEGSLGIKQT